MLRAPLRWRPARGTSRPAAAARRALTNNSAADPRGVPGTAAWQTTIFESANTTVTKQVFYRYSYDSMIRFVRAERPGHFERT